MKKVTILGSTGSIGRQTLDVIAKNPEEFQVEALVAKKNYQQLAEQCAQFQARYAVITDQNLSEKLSAELKKKNSRTEVLTGANAMNQIAADPASHIVVAAIVGAQGLLPTLAAVKADKRILLANKEALIMAGELFITELKKSQTQLLPVDSEHNAIWQCLPANFIPGISRAEHVKSIILTASGGPFRTTPLEEFPRITPEQAVAHPNWNMGAKISVDSATMMNKGLEVIEAHWLFNLQLEQIEVILHPQSIIHSMVRYIDGSVLAQMGQPDMRTPIAVTLAWPKRIEAGVADLDFLKMSALDFAPLDLKRYPSLQLAYDALKVGKNAPTILNAANEVAVEMFLQRQIRFDQISNIINQVLQHIPTETLSTIDEILHMDQKARDFAQQLAKI